MADREKTIAELANIANCLYPYIGSKQIRACLDAIELLKEQEPVEPFHVCIYGKRLRTLISNRYFIFCPYCGRKVKWDA